MSTTKNEFEWKRADDGDIEGLLLNGEEVFVAGQCQWTGFLVFRKPEFADMLLTLLNQTTKLVPRAN